MENKWRERAISAAVGGAILFGVGRVVDETYGDVSPVQIYISPKELATPLGNLEKVTEEERASIDREKMILELKSFVNKNVDIEHDRDFWNHFQNFLDNADEAMRIRKISSAITEDSGRIEIFWPEDIPIREKSSPTIYYDRWEGHDGNGYADLKRFGMRIVPEEKLIEGKAGVAFQSQQEMEHALMSVLKRDEIKNAASEIRFETDGNISSISKSVMIGGVIHSVGINNSGFIFISERHRAPFETSPINPPSKT